MSSKFSCLQLFNALNGSMPLIMVDTRGHIAFSESHVRESINVPEFDFGNLQAEIQKVLELRQYLTEVVLLFIFGDAASIGAGYLSLANPNDQTKLPENLRSIFVLDKPYSSFRETYLHCLSLFQGSREAQGPPEIRSYPTEILPEFLFLGDSLQATNKRLLKDLQITHIIDATGVEASKSHAARLEIQYLHYDIEDIETANIAQHFDSAIEFISAAKQHEDGRIFVHCRAGISRSASLVLAYLLHSKAAASLQHGLEMVLSERPWVCPNPGFRSQLRQYECTLLQASTATPATPTNSINTDSTVDISAPSPVTGSFATDEEMREYIGQFLMWYVGTPSLVDTPRERVAVGTGLDARVYQNEEHLRAKGAFADTNDGVAKAAVPKRPFLKRGAGRSSASAPTAASTAAVAIGVAVVAAPQSSTEDQ